MPTSDDEDLLPSFKPAWAREGGIPKRTPPAATMGGWGDAAGLTVGSWNLLNPADALQNKEPEGIKQADVGEEGDREARRFAMDARVQRLMEKNGNVLKRLQKEAREKGISLQRRGLLSDTGEFECVELDGGNQRDCFTLKAHILKLANSSWSGGVSNWAERAPEIGRRLVAGGLDVYLLQEVGKEQLADIESFTSELYESRHTVHPLRSSNDGVAILVRKARLRIESHETLPLIGVHNTQVREEARGVHRMSALLATARDVVTGTPVLLGCAHFYPKKCDDPHGTLLAALARLSGQGPKP